MLLNVYMNDKKMVKAWGYYWGTVIDAETEADRDNQDYESAMRGYYFERNGLPEMLEHFEAGAMAAIQQPHYLSVTEAAEMANVGRRYINDEIRAGRLFAAKVGRQYQIEMSDFEKWRDNPRRGSRS